MKKLGALLLFVYLSFLLPWISLGQGKEEMNQEVETTLENWIDYAANSFAGGTGTEDDPYLIETAEQLAYLAKTTNEGNSYKGYFFKLTADIDLGGKEWTPIGTTKRYEYHFRGAYTFCGSFNGDNRNVMNLTIKESRPESGFFGVVIDGLIENLNLSRIYIYGGYHSAGIAAAGVSVAVVNCKVEGTIKGFKSVGGILGTSFKAIVKDSEISSDITFIDQATYHKLIASGIPANVEFFHSSFGGIIGTLDYFGHSIIERCILKIKIDGGGVTGGIVGDQDGPLDISNCSVIGDISGGTSIGGFIGKYTDASAMLGGKRPSILKNCIFKGSIKGKYVGGVSRKFIGNIENCAIWGEFHGEKIEEFARSYGSSSGIYSSSAWIKTKTSTNVIKNIKTLWDLNGSNIKINLSPLSILEIAPFVKSFSVQRAIAISSEVSFDLGDEGFEIIPQNFVGASLDIEGSCLRISGITYAAEGSYEIIAVKSPDVVIIPLRIISKEVK